MKRIFTKLQEYLVYVIVIVVSMFMLEFFIPTKMTAVGLSIFSALLNFFKLVAIKVVVKKLKKKLEKWKFRGTMKRLLEVAIKFPIPIYSIYLLWYIIVTLGIYLITENEIAANIALQNAIAMCVGILVGVIAVMRERKKIQVAGKSGNLFFLIILFSIPLKITALFLP